MAAEKEKDRVMKVKLERSKLEHFDASKYVKFVPPFIEKDVDKYFLLFEKVFKRFELAFGQVYYSSPKCSQR